MPRHHSFSEYKSNNYILNKQINYKLFSLLFTAHIHYTLLFPCLISFRFLSGLGEMCRNFALSTIMPMCLYV